MKLARISCFWIFSRKPVLYCFLNTGSLKRPLLAKELITHFFAPTTKSKYSLFWNSNTQRNHRLKLYLENRSARFNPVWLLSLRKVALFRIISSSLSWTKILSRRLELIGLNMTWGVCLNCEMSSICLTCSPLVVTTLPGTRKMKPGFTPPS